jgi:hypothetical protein
LSAFCSKVRPDIEQTAYLHGLVSAESSATKACLM